MLRQLTPAEIDLYTKDDPVRPHIPAEFRHSHGRQVWGLFEDRYGVMLTYDKPQAIICVAYTWDIPKDEQELERYSNTHSRGGPLTTNTAVFYTVWSYSAGAGRQIVNTLAAHILHTRREIEQWVTLSPLTDMATRFHTKNGAVLNSVHDTCQVFEYTHLMESAL